MATAWIIVTELKDTFFSAKTNKCPGHDEINFNEIRSCFGELCEPLQYLFNLAFGKSIFSGDLKVTKVTPIFKVDSNTELSNYRAISVLPLFLQNTWVSYVQSLMQILTRFKHTL